MSNAHEEIDNAIFVNSLKNLITGQVNVDNRPIATELHHMHDKRYKMPGKFPKTSGVGTKSPFPPYTPPTGYKIPSPPPTPTRGIPSGIPQQQGVGGAGTLPLIALLMTLIEGTTKSEGEDKTPFQEMGGNIADWLVPTGEGTVPEVDLYSLLDSQVTAEDEALYEKDLQQRKGMDFRNLLNVIGGAPKGVR